MQTEIMNKLNKTTLSQDVKFSDLVQSLETLEIEVYENNKNNGVALIKATKKSGVSKDLFKEEVIKMFEKEEFSNLTVKRENAQAMWVAVTVSL